jgi:5-methylcytosine-specific restriction protein A
MRLKSPEISKDTFIEILQDAKIIQADELLIFQTLHSLDKQEASATEIATILGWKSKSVLIGKIVGLGNRVMKKYRIKPRQLEDGTYTVWDFFFTGYKKGSFFIYRLRPELKEALEESSLTANKIPLSTQNAFLFTWNPSKWEWYDIEEKIEEITNAGKCIKEWSCISHTKVKPGDRAFLARVGSNPRGIIGSGTIISHSFLGDHWEDNEKSIYFVSIEFDVLLNPGEEPILTVDNLNSGNLVLQSWTPQSSGIAIKQEAKSELEEAWFEFLTTQNIRRNPFVEDLISATSFVEGASSQIVQTRYERNPYARSACLSHYGFTCCVCSFNFEKVYGSIGYKFIHVHHLTQISKVKQQYRVDPIKDLRPVCPNCHSMLHRQVPALTIDELKIMIQGTSY